MAELEHAGIIERTGEMRWAERSREWQPVYATHGTGTRPVRRRDQSRRLSRQGQLTSRGTKQPGEAAQSRPNGSSTDLPSRQPNPTWKLNTSPQTKLPPITACNRTHQADEMSEPAYLKRRRRPFSSPSAPTTRVEKGQTAPATAALGDTVWLRLATVL